MTFPEFLSEHGLEQRPDFNHQRLDIYKRDTDELMATLSREEIMACISHELTIAILKKKLGL